MSVRKSRLSKLLYSNQFLLAVSLCIAVVLWLIIAIQFSPVIEAEIEDVNVVIEYAGTVTEQNLVNFSGEDFRVNVRVRGKRFDVNAIQEAKDEIRVTASTNYVNAPGSHQLPLSAVLVNTSRDVTVEGLDMGFINVYFDEEIQRTMDLFTMISPSEENGDIAPEGYEADHERLSVSHVTVAGAAMEVNKVDRVVASVKLPEPLTATATLPAAVSILNFLGSELRNFVWIEETDITMTIPVYKRVPMPVSVSYKNAPAAYLDTPLPMTFSPESAEFGISEDQLERRNSVVVGTVDFTQLPAWSTKSFTFNTSDLNLADLNLTEMKVLSNTKSFRVTVDTTRMRSKQVSVLTNNILKRNKPDNMEATIVRGISSVTAVGPQASLDRLTADDVYADVDFNVSTLEPKNGVYDLPAKVYVKGFDDCWIYGTYKVKVEVTVG